MGKVKLGDIAVLINGDRGKNYPSQKEIITSGGIPFVNAGHLNGRAIEFEAMNYITPEKYEKLNSGKFQQNDILYCLRGSLGKKALINDNIYGAIASSLVIIRPNLEKVRPQYLMLALETPLIKEQLFKFNNGSSQPNLSAKSVKEYKLELPDLFIQDSIISKLEKVRNLIEDEKQEKLLLDNLIQARFVEMFGSVHDGRFEMKTLPEIVMKERNAIKRGPFGGSLKKQDFVEKGYLVYEQKHAIHEDFEYEKYYITKKKYEDMIAFKVIPGDLIVSCSGTLGRIAEVPNNAPEGIINQALLKLSLDQTIMKNKFFVYQFRNKEIQDILFGFSRGSGIPNMPSMNEIKKVKFLCPPIDLQNQFAIVVEQVNKSKFVIHKFLYCTTHNTQSIIKPRPNTKESGKTRGGKPYADEF